MSMSGVEVEPEITTLFNDMKLRSTHKWATFKISEDKKSVSVDEKGEPCLTNTKGEDENKFNELKEKLDKEPRYILYDFAFPLEDGRKLKKLAFIFWCPDNVKIGDKMIYASTKDAVKKSFSGLGLEFQANDLEDFDYNTWSGEVERKA